MMAMSCPRACQPAIRRHVPVLGKIPRADRGCKFTAPRQTSVRVHARGSKKSSPKSDSPKCTSPVPTSVVEILSDPAPASVPLWSTFCGNCSGEWHGSAIAYNPLNARAEAMTLNEDRKKVYEMTCVTIEDRVVDGEGVDMLHRESFRACTPPEIGSAELRAAAALDEDSAVMYDQTKLIDEEDGLVIFEAGAYSAGPSKIGCTVPGKENVISLEQCVTWGGHSRVRCQMSLSTMGGQDGSDIDIDVLRLVLFHETWEGPPGYCDKEDRCVVPKAPKVLEMERLAAWDMAGEWKAFDIGSLPVVDDINGTEDKAMLVYFSSETSQVWTEPDMAPGEGGISLWMPGKVAVSMSINPGFLHNEADGGLSMGGVVFGLGWMAKDGTWVSLEREYSGEGLLREVRSSTACQGGWIGGAMGGHSRVRCQMSLSTMGGQDGSDIDIDVLRLVLFHETWEGPPGYCDKEDRCVVPKAPKVLEMERLAAWDMAGEWKAFDIGSLPVVDDINGTEDKAMLVYFSSETSQVWTEPDMAPGEGGISLWMPGKVAVSMSINPGFLHNEADGGLSMGGVVFGLGWMAKDGTWVSLEREYSGEGLLREVRSSTACQGGWIGGAM